MDSTINVALIYGSARPGRFCDTVARWAAAEITARPVLRLASVDPADLPPPGGHEDRALAVLGERLGWADAFVVVTPEYNHGYSASLKSLIDSFYAEWQGKPVAFVSYGGASGGLRAVEQLRLVFAELHAVTLRDTVSFANAHDRFDIDGVLRAPERHRRAMATMLDRLTWWARALKTARASVPYGSAA